MMTTELDSILLTSFVFVFVTFLSFSILESEATIEVTPGRCCVLESRKKEERERETRCTNLLDDDANRTLPFIESKSILSFLLFLLTFLTPSPPPSSPQSSRPLFSFFLSSFHDNRLLFSCLFFKIFMEVFLSFFFFRSCRLRASTRTTSLFLGQRTVIDDYLIDLSDLINLHRFFLPFFFFFDFILL